MICHRHDSLYLRVESVVKLHTTYQQKYEVAYTWQPNGRFCVGHAHSQMPGPHFSSTRCRGWANKKVTLAGFLTNCAKICSSKACFGNARTASGAKCWIKNKFKHCLSEVINN